MRSRRAAFTLIELLVVIAIIALLVSILLPALALARQAGRKAVCTSNLHQFAIGHNTYGNDYKERIATFSWRPNVRTADYPDLQPPLHDFNDARGDSSVAVLQATNIARQLLDHNELRTPLPAEFEWAPHAFYSHLVMNAYLAHRLPEKMVLCPEDSFRITAQTEWLTTKRLAPVTDTSWRFACASSYLLTPASWSADQAHPVTFENTVGPGDTHYEVTVGLQRLGTRRHSDVAFPSQKVALMDSLGRHSGKTSSYYAYDDVVQPLLFWDSSVRDIRSGSANFGADPNFPTDPSPLRIMYTPDAASYGDPPTRSGESSEEVFARYQWTRGGLKGVDVQGRESLPK